uniref:Carb-bd_dom_fam9 domain-containing protein n=1 Tax=Caenorhabditis tropicalis TaxID=1561998 RepID=A0A1I7THP7_9PELO
MQNLIRSVKWKEILRIECYACSFAFAIYNKDNTKVEVVACGSKEPNYIEETYAVTIDGKHIEVCSPYFNFVFYYPSETPRTYIVRDDGIVAYITLESGKLWFQVKNFTEK